jgi:hypothetical protein
MKAKFIPFKKKTKGPEMNSQGPTTSPDGNILDHGTLGDGNYEIYKRGVIKIFKDDLVFKKDINLFDKEVSAIDFENLQDPFIMKGSGDNDNLVFSKVEGDIQITLKKRGFKGIETLQAVLNKGKKLLGQEDGKAN